MGELLFCALIWSKSQSWIGLGWSISMLGTASERQYGMWSVKPANCATAWIANGRWKQHQHIFRDLEPVHIRLYHWAYHMCVRSSLHDVINPSLSAMFVQLLSTEFVCIRHLPSHLVTQVGQRSVQHVILQFQRILVTKMVKSSTKKKGGCTM